MTAHRMPRWVKVCMVVVLVLLAALAVSALLGVEHGPGMHGAVDVAARGLSRG